MSDPSQITDTQLFQAAKLAMESAYAPYSHFRVGAAILTKTGAIYQGCNVENAAYPQSQCAEANAIAMMVLAGQREIVKIAVCADSAPAVTPCGGCRQKINEFALADTEILSCDATGIRARYVHGQLLPHSFGPNSFTPKRHGDGH